jgi:hypothetical protein
MFGPQLPAVRGGVEQLARPWRGARRATLECSPVRQPVRRRPPASADPHRPAWRGSWMRPVVNESGRPLPRLVSRGSSAAMDTAVSSGVRAPRSRPIGERRLDTSSSVTPRDRSRDSRSSWVAAPHGTDVSGIGPGCHLEERNVELRVVREDADGGTSTDGRPREVPVRPIDDDLIGVGEPLRRREETASVADGNAVAEEGPERGHRPSEIDSPEDQQAWPSSERADGDLDITTAPLSVDAVGAHRAPPPVEESASVIGRRGVETSGSERTCGLVRPDGESGPSSPWPPTTVTMATGSSRLSDARTSGKTTPGLVGMMTRSISPPHVSPTATALSSLMPYRMRRERPVSSTSRRIS